MDVALSYLSSLSSYSQPGGSQSLRLVLTLCPLGGLFKLQNNKSLCICCKCFETSYFGRIPFSSFWSRELGNFHSSRLLWWQPNDVQPTNKNFTTVTKVYCTTASITSCISFNHQCANTPGTGWLNVQDSGIGNPRYQRISMLAKTPNICCFVAKLHLSQFNWFQPLIIIQIDYPMLLNR